MTRPFSLGAVLSVTTGKLLCSMGDVYEILNYMTADSIFTHQIPRAMEECRPYLARQFPEVAALDASMVSDAATSREFLRVQREQFGDMIVVAPIPRDDHTYRNPVEELVEMMGGDESKVIVIRPETEE